MNMEIVLTPEQESFIEDGVRTGRYQRAEAAVQEAMLQWEEKERRRFEILASVERSRAEIARGEGRSVSTELDAAEFARSIRERGRARLANLQRHL